MSWDMLLALDELVSFLFGFFLFFSYRMWNEKVGLRIWYFICALFGGLGFVFIVMSALNPNPEISIYANLAILIMAGLISFGLGFVLLLVLTEPKPSDL